MSTITNLSVGDSGSTSLTTINTNTTNLNTDKAEKTGQVFSGQVSFSGTTHSGVKVISLTTTQRNALTPANGMIIYNSTDNKYQIYEATSWVDITASVANASAIVRGIVEIATDAEIQAGTTSGGTGALLVVPSGSSHLPTDNQMAAFAGTSGTAPSGSNKLVDAADVASAKTASKIARRDANADILVATTPTAGDAATSKTYVDSFAYFLSKNGVATRAGNTASGSQTIAHGLGRIPKLVKISAFSAQTPSGATAGVSSSIGIYNGATTACVFSSAQSATSAASSGNSTTNIVSITNIGATASNVATCTVDATNITLAWTLSGTMNADNINIMWEVW